MVRIHSLLIFVPLSFLLINVSLFHPFYILSSMAPYSPLHPQPLWHHALFSSLVVLLIRVQSLFAIVSPLFQPSVPCALPYISSRSERTPPLLPRVSLFVVTRVKSNLLFLPSDPPEPLLSLFTDPCHRVSETRPPTCTYSHRPISQKQTSNEQYYRYHHQR